jgi:O-antigen/teichoic acid export membrane protein
MRHGVVSNAALLAGLRVLGPACSLLLVLAISRRLGAEDLGRYGLAYAYLTVFGIVAPLGLPGLLIRDGARHPPALGKLLANATALGAGLSILLGLAMAGAGRFLEYDAATSAALLILSLALLPSTLLAYTEAAFLALERPRPMFWASLVEHALKVGLGVALLGRGYGLPAVLAAAVLGRVAASTVSLVWLHRLGVLRRWHADRTVLRGLAAQGPVLALSGICATLCWRSDVFLLAHWKGAAEVGLYTAAYRLLDVAILAPQCLCQALSPQLAASRGRCASGPVLLRRLIGFNLALAAALTLAAAPVLRLLYGPGFRAAAPVLALLIWTAAPYAWNRYQAAVLVASDRHRTDLALNAGVLTLNVLLNLAAIPQWGARGAAAVTLAGALVYAAVQGAVLRQSGAVAGERGVVHAT